MNIKEVKKLIVFASHPDDETIGCGGTIKNSQKADEVIVVFATTGNTGVDQSRNYEKNIKSTRLKRQIKQQKF